MLLNPCTCKSTGICKCCHPKRPSNEERLRAAAGSARKQINRSPSGTRTPTEPAGHAQITDSLIEMFEASAMTRTSATTASNTPSEAGISPISPTAIRPAPSHLLAPSNMHHPAHTSPHVHKTKLYSPYSTGSSTPRHGHKRDSPPTAHQGWASSASPYRPPPPKLKPLADMNTFLGAVFREDGSVANQIPRSALGLPGIQSFDAMAENGGVKVEPMEMDVDPPLAFPTSEDVVIGACTCGEGCECPGCATHGNPARPAGEHHDGSCGPHCKSCFDCADHLSLPSGIQSIQHLLSLAAANVPNPPSLRPANLDAHDTRILPPAVHVSEDAARSLGVVQLKPLECCNGRCQCPAGQCTCEKECCGCCVRCACGDDGDDKMDGSASAPATDAPSTTSSCCGGGGSSTAAQAQAASAPSVSSSTPPILSPTAVHPAAALPRSHTSSPCPSGNVTPNNPSPSAPPLRRASSTSQGHHLPSSSGAARRATVTSHSHAASVQRSASTGKSASKALALHTTPNHPHPRPILPKPASHGTAAAHLKVSKEGNGAGSRNPSPAGRRTSSSTGHSRTGTPPPPGSGSGSGSARPGVPAVPAVPSLPAISMAGSTAETQQQVSESSQSGDAAVSAPTDSLPAMSEEDFLAYLTELTSSDPALLQALTGQLESQPQDQNASSSQVPVQVQTQNPAPDSAPAQPLTSEVQSRLLNDWEPGQSGWTFTQNTEGQPDDFFDLVARALAHQAQSGDQFVPALSVDSHSSQSNPSSRDPMHVPEIQQGQARPHPPPQIQAQHTQSQNQPQRQPQPQPQQRPHTRQLGTPQFNMPIQTGETNPTFFPGFPDQTQFALPEGFGLRHTPSEAGSQTTPNDIFPPSDFLGSIPFDAGNTAGALSPESILNMFFSQQNAQNLAKPPSPQPPLPAAQQPPPSMQQPSQAKAMPQPAPVPAASQVPVSMMGQTLNPNIIDLSKPLDAQDVERILRALQQQQQQNGAAPAEPNQQQSQQAQTQQQRQQQPLNAGYDFQPTTVDHRSGVSSAPNGFAGNALGSSSGDAGLTFPITSEADDVFEQYVYDPAGEGLDLSGLDLGDGVGMGSSAGDEAGGSGENLGELGEGLSWEQIRMWGGGGEGVGSSHS